MKSRSCPSRGFTFIALLVIIAVVAILAAMLLPALAKAKQRAQRINCVNNLKQDGLAFRVWAMDHEDFNPMGAPAEKGGTKEYAEDGTMMFKHFQVMSNELNTPKILVCPADDRTAATRFTNLKNRNISYFVGLDAIDTYPDMFLAGDRNLTNGLPIRKGILELRPDHRAGWTEAIHDKTGNVGLADGSVQMFTTLKLREAIRRTGNGTNRIALPQ